MDRANSVASRLALLVATAFAFAFASMSVLADPPTRAARISFVSGSASFAPAGSDEWLHARINRPLWIGDRLWSADGRIELQIGGASLRLAPQTSLQILNFDDRIAQFEVTQGSVALHVRAIDSNDTIEIDTPSFAFVTREEGDYRIDVERDYTAVSTRRGYADIYGQDVAYRVDRRERFAFYSPDLRDYDAGPLPPPDGFDRWNRERAQREDRSISSRYVSPELVGYVDLDSHGEWRSDTTYGNVWIPRVAADWAPYRYGHWSWIDPWGWTWVDDAPWGFAPSHYGRWTQLGRTWAWVPGPRDVRPAYSPALVAWIGGDNFSLTVSSGRTRGVGWFPLAPGEVWRPSYDVSREYFTRVNVANTVVNNTTVINVYNNRNETRVTNVDYRFRAAPAAVTAVSVDAFVQGRPVQQTHAQMNANAAAQTTVLAVAPAQPTRQSVVGPAPRVQAKPPAETVQRTVVARTPPPPAPPSIEQRTALVRDGKPLTREILDRGAGQPATPQKPVPPVAGPAPAGQAPAPQAAQAPAGAPPPPRANVRVVEADKAAPKPLPEGTGRAARGDDPRGRGPQDSQAGQRVKPEPPDRPAQQAGQPGGTPPTAPARAPQPGQGGQTATPAPSGPPAKAPQVAQPQPAPPPAPRAAPPAGAPASQAAEPRPVPSQAAPPPIATPQAGAGSPETGRAAPPAPGPGAAPPSRLPVTPPTAQPSAREGGPPAVQGGPPRGPAAAPAETPNRREGQAAPPARPDTAPPAAAKSPGPPAAPSARPPVGEPPAAERGRNEAAERRNGDVPGRPGRPQDERRAQPPQSAPGPQAAPPPARPDAATRAAPAPQGPPPNARPAPEPPAAQGQAPAKGGDRAKDARPDKDKDRDDKDKKDRDDKDKKARDEKEKS